MAERHERDRSATGDDCFMTDYQTTPDCLHTPIWRRIRSTLKEGRAKVLRSLHTYIHTYIHVCGGGPGSLIGGGSGGFTRALSITHGPVERPGEIGSISIGAGRTAGKMTKTRSGAGSDPCRVAPDGHIFPRSGRLIGPAVSSPGGLRGPQTGAELTRPTNKRLKTTFRTSERPTQSRTRRTMANAANHLPADSGANRSPIPAETDH